MSEPAPATFADVGPRLAANAAAFPDTRHPISVDCDASIRLTRDEVDAVETITREALANALRHAFPDGRDGRIWVSLAPDRERVRLRIRDNGVGFPDLGPDPRSGRGRIQALAEGLGGYARLGSAAFGGGEVTAVFPPVQVA